VVMIIRVFPKKTERLKLFSCLTKWKRTSFKKRLWYNLYT